MLDARMRNAKWRLGKIIETNSLGCRMEELEKKWVPVWEIALKADRKNSP